MRPVVGFTTQISFASGEYVAPGSTQLVRRLIVRSTGRVHPSALVRGQKPVAFNLLSKYSGRDVTAIDSFHLSAPVCAVKDSLVKNNLKCAVVVHDLYFSTGAVSLKLEIEK